MSIILFAAVFVCRVCFSRVVHTEEIGSIHATVVTFAGHSQMDPADRVGEDRAYSKTYMTHRTPGRLGVKPVNG